MSAPQLGRSRESQPRFVAVDSKTTRLPVASIAGSLLIAVGFPPVRRHAHQVPQAITDALHVHLRARDIRAAAVRSIWVART